MKEVQKFNHNDSTGSTRSDTSTVNLTEDDDAAPPAKKAKKGLMSLLDDVINSKADDDEAALLSDTERKKVEVEREMNNYLSLDTSVLGNPLIWWRENQKHFPQLAKLAKKYLCVPATSVPSERAFSMAGHVVNEKRSSLLPENVNMLVFLSANLEVNCNKNKS